MPIDQVNTCAGADSSEHLNELQECKLHSIADIRFSNVDKVSRPSEKPVRLCNYMDVYTNDYINADINFMRATANDAEIERFGIQSGDVIITKDSEKPDDIGISTVVDTSDSDLVCGYHLTLLRPNQKNVDPTFLAKQLNHPRVSKYFFQQANGTTRYGLSSASIANTPLWLPRIETQKYCSAVMRLLDKCIAQTEAVIAKLKKIREGLLHDLLTYGLDKHGQIRDPVAHPEQFKNASLGRIPRDWDVKALKSLAIVQRGKFTHRPRNDPEYYGGLHPFIQTGDIAAAEGEEVYEASQFLSDLGTTVSMKFPTGTIAVTIAANIGDTAILGRPMFFPDSVVGVVVNKKESIRWIELYLRHSKKRLDALAPQSAQKNINLTFLRPLLIAVPPVAKQKQCSRLYEKISHQLKTEAVVLSKLKSLKSGLLNDLLTGRIRVPESS